MDRIKDWSLLRRLSPYGADLGLRRGKYIDRFYIEKFLSIHQACIRGRVAEIQSGEYTRLFGGAPVDLAQTISVPESAFDCIICTQTLLLIYDYASAIRSLHKMLKPGGVLLVTIPGICRSIPRSMLGGADNDWWRFTGSSARRIFAEAFEDENMIVETYGNVLTATAFLHGLVQEELALSELEFHDPDYEVIIGVKVTKRVGQ